MHSRRRRRALRSEPKRKREEPMHGKVRASAFKVELRFWLLSPSWWVMRIFPALLIVGGYLALYRRRWAPLVLTASVVGALWVLWGYVSSLDPHSR